MGREEGACIVCDMFYFREAHTYLLVGIPNRWLVIDSHGSLILDTRGQQIQNTHRTGYGRRKQFLNCQPKRLGEILYIRFASNREQACIEEGKRKTMVIQAVSNFRDFFCEIMFEG